MPHIWLGSYIKPSQSYHFLYRRPLIVEVNKYRDELFKIDWFRAREEAGATDLEESLEYEIIPKVREEHKGESI